MKTPAPKIPSSKISGAQVRAARAMVGWTARALAKAVVPIFTLVNRRPEVNCLPDREFVGHR